MMKFCELDFLFFIIVITIINIAILNGLFLKPVTFG